MWGFPLTFLINLTVLLCLRFNLLGLGLFCRRIKIQIPPKSLWMICFPMMKMTKDKEVSVLQVTFLLCFCSAEYKDALYKNVSMLGDHCNTAGVVNASARIRNPVIDIHSVHWYVQNWGLGFLRVY